MSGRRRTAIVAVGGVVLLAGVALLVWRAVDDGSSSPAPTASTDGSGIAAAVVVGPTAARDPFAAFTAGTIRVGGRPVEVVVADSLDEWVQGLRGRRDASPYAGMLFVFDEDSRGAFTMAGVPAALDIAFFDARGRRVDQLRMEPCAGTDATCPTYEASAPYRYTLETAPGAMPAGRLRVSTRG